MYSIEDLVDFRSTSLPLTKDSFEEIVAHREKLDRINDCEFNFWAFTEAYRELVECSLSISCEWGLYSKFDGQALVLARSRISMRLDIFLVAFERYVGSAEGILKAAGVQGVKKRFFTPLYDGHFEYRLCCGLRNYASHVAHAATGITIARKREEVSQAINLSVRVTVSVESILKWGKISTDLKRDIEAMVAVGAESINLMEVVAKCCSLVWDAHCSIRDKMMLVANESRGEIHCWERQWRERQPQATSEVWRVNKPVIVAKSAEKTVAFETEDDQAIAAIRRLTDKIGVADKLRITSS